jgi:hypothetical protein
MNDDLKKELDAISSKHLSKVKETFIKEYGDQTKRAYDREYNSFLMTLITKSDDYKLVNNKEVESYIKELTAKSQDFFNGLLNQ